MDRDRKLLYIKVEILIKNVQQLLDVCQELDKYELLRIYLNALEKTKELLVQATNEMRGVIHEEVKHSALMNIYL